MYLNACYPMSFLSMERLKAKQMRWLIAKGSREGDQVVSGVTGKVKTLQGWNSSLCYIEVARESSAVANIKQ